MSDKVIIALISVFGPLVGVLGKIIWDVYKNRKHHAMGQYIDLVREIYTYLEIARQDLGCARVMILKAENGGGIPRAGHQIYSTAIWESTDNNTPSIRNFWIRQEIDEQYAQMLSEVVSQDVCTVVTDKMKKGILKDLYQSNNITKSQIYKIYSGEEKFIYVSFGYKNDINLDKPNIRNNTRAVVQKLKDIMKKMEELS